MFKQPSKIALLAGIALFAGIGLLKHLADTPDNTRENTPEKTDGPVLADAPLWGDLHVHSNFSFDAYSFGNTNLGPDKAYEFAMGKPVRAHNGEIAQLAKPLDFLLVADHSEFMGLFRGMDNNDPTIMDSALGQRWSGYFNAGTQAPISHEYVQMIERQREIERLPYDFSKNVWLNLIDIAERYNKPGRFTTLLGYEWTSMVQGDNLHRVVVYRDNPDRAGQLLPLSALDSPDPEDLWDFLAGYEAETGGQAIAIPHNGNVSNGVMFADTRLDGGPLTPDYAEKRQKWEPLYEVTQVKGDAEAHPFLSPEDEFADFETWDQGNLRMDEKKPEMLAAEYARPALKRGLKYQVELGVNPFKFGLIGSTDTHTSLSTADDNNFFGKFVDSEPGTTRTSSTLGNRLWDNWRLSASGYTAVWAQENSRTAIFDALRRKEVYATTGPRIMMRFFAGWDFTAADLERDDLIAHGYAAGVPMGGELRNELQNELQNEIATAENTVPRFILLGRKDPDGAPLDRLQIIKGWRDTDGKLHEQVFTVAQAGKAGADALKTVWEDTGFNPAEEAFYYARIIEQPSPRWTSYDAERYGVALAPEIPRTTQERAYSSPIWYSHKVKP